MDDLSLVYYGHVFDATGYGRAARGYLHALHTAGITDTRQGRGLIHLDYDSDGDLDLLVINNADAPILAVFA